MLVRSAILIPKIRVECHIYIARKLSMVELWNKMCGFHEGDEWIVGKLSRFAHISKDYDKDLVEIFLHLNLNLILLKVTKNYI